jgi:hypothetical protein
MNLTEFRMRAMNDEVQMIEDFNFFEQKVASFKRLVSIALCQNQ